ncbi:uncharacterized protein LOC134554368 [Prinia subflava]|uniref:uncharacterized protein LOC134554368 n=1 Tax=Prinia subflava TaxID=208062 RepID=UPI002FE1914F
MRRGQPSEARLAGLFPTSPAEPAPEKPPDTLPAWEPSPGPGSGTAAGAGPGCTLQRLGSGQRKLQQLRPRWERQRKAGQPQRRDLSSLRESFRPARCLRLARLCRVEAAAAWAQEGDNAARSRCRPGRRAPLATVAVQMCPCVPGPLLGAFQGGSRAMSSPILPSAERNGCCSLHSPAEQRSLCEEEPVPHRFLRPPPVTHRVLRAQRRPRQETESVSEKRSGNFLSEAAGEVGLGSTGCRRR